MLKKGIKFVKSYIAYIRCKRKYKNIDFFQYEKLAYSNFITPSSFTSVSLYGNYKAVACLKGSSFNFLTEYLEHGLCFYESTESVPALGYADRKFIRRIYTYGEKRKLTIEKYLLEKKPEREVISIGPYIKGSRHFYSFDELNKLKSQYGKILLVFPMHSVETAKAQYDHSSFMDMIKQVKENFDSVFICVYWKDIIDTPEYVKQYEENGFTVVCNGHRGDPRFLCRQKDLIHLSDMVMTNALGTYIGYAISMGKPVYYCPQEVSYKLENHQFTGFLSEQKKYISQVEREFIRLFGEFSFNITEEQILLIEQYWGKWKK